MLVYQAVVGICFVGIVVVGALTHLALLHSVSELKAIKNAQESQIRGLILYEVKLGHKAVEASKNICSKDEGAFDVGSVTRLFKKFVRVAQTSMIRQSQVGPKLWIPKPCSKLDTQIWRVTLKLGISLSSVIRHDLRKSILICEIASQVLAKYRKTFDSPKYL